MSNSSAASHRRATVLGLGLIGGSICVALRDRGWIVSGDDHNPDRVRPNKILALDSRLLDRRYGHQTSNLSGVAIHRSTSA